MWQDLLQEENEELKGLRDFHSHRIKMSEEERSTEEAIAKDHGALLSVGRIRKEEVLADLGVVQKRIVGQNVII